MSKLFLKLYLFKIKTTKHCLKLACGTIPVLQFQVNLKHHKAHSYNVTNKFRNYET
jgi:hypothetical protein